MAPTATSDSLECDYLHSHSRPIPHSFASEQAELAHINEQIRSLDDHISQLNTLRHTLHHRSCQLHNGLAPIHGLPTEVLSRIFQSAIEPEYPVLYRAKFDEYRACLRDAFILCSVSVHFRRAALGTPELWKGVPICMYRVVTIDKASSLLQHCVALTSNLNISVRDALNETEAWSAVETLLTSDVTQKMKGFEICDSPLALNVWIASLKGSFFPILDTLDIFCGEESLDLGTLNTLTKLKIYKPHQEHPIIVPPSLRYLFIDDIRHKLVIPILYQCPNLEECVVIGSYHTDILDLNNGTQFNEPLTLTRLKRLTLGVINITPTPSSAQNLQLPSLEYLKLEEYDPENFNGIILLCRNVSATLTTLKIELIIDAPLGYDDDLYRLCGVSFPNLRKLGFHITHSVPTLSAVRALIRQAEECSNAKRPYLPSLTTLTLRCGYETTPYCFLDLLDKWRLGETSYFHLKVKGSSLGSRDWLPEVHEKLRSIVGNRQIEVTWGRSKVQQLLRGTDGSLQKTRMY